jgi:integrase
VTRGVAMPRTALFDRPTFMRLLGSGFGENWLLHHDLDVVAVFGLHALGRVQFPRRAQVQRRAGFDRLYPFHCLRYSSVTNVYRQTRDLFLAQRFARHASPLTTTIYTHPSDDEMSKILRALPC